MRFDLKGLRMSVHQKQPNTCTNALTSAPAEEAPRARSRPLGADRAAAFSKQRGMRALIVLWCPS